MGRGGGPETTVREIVINICVVRPVEEVEHFEPELENHALCNVRIFVEVDIGLEKFGPRNCIAFSLPPKPNAGTAKLVLGIAPVSHDLLSVD